MQVVIDATTTQDMSYSGTGQYTHNLVVSLAAGFPETRYKLLLYSDLPSTLDKCGIFKSRNISVERIGRSLPSFMNTFTYLTRIAPKISRLLSSGEKIIYFAPYFQRGFPTEPIPSVVSVFDFAMPQFNSFSNKGFLTNLLRKCEFWYRMRQTTKVSGVIVISENTKKEYKSHFPKFPENRITLTHLGVDIETKNSKKFERLLPKDWRKRGYFIYLGGGIQKNKNSEGVINAYRCFIKLISESSYKEEAPYLVIAGKIFEDQRSTQSKNLSSMVKEFDLDEDVVFTGFYSEQDKYQLLHNSIAFIHLSLCEGFGISVVEAMRSKTPVIVHNGSSYPEVVQDAGLLVDGLDPEAVANEMLKVFNSKEFRNSLIQKGYQRSLNFNWETTAQLTHNVLKSIYEKVYLSKR